MSEDNKTHPDTPIAKRSSTMVERMSKCPKCTNPETRRQDGGDCDLCYNADPQIAACTRHVPLSKCTAWLLREGHSLDSSSDEIPDTEPGT